MMLELILKSCREKKTLSAGYRYIIHRALQNCKSSRFVDLPTDLQQRMRQR
jgi:hypothetical protein